MTGTAPAGDAREARWGAASPAPTGAAAGRGADVLYSIGEVLNLLRPEFADVTISKLRFLEAEGLVDPLRTPAGYRKYTPAHVERLRLVLAAQRDRYLPLRVIREQLAALERGERVIGSPLPAAPLGGPAPTVPTHTSPGSAEADTRLASVAPVGEARLSRAQVLARSGLDEAGITDLEQYGLLVPGPGGYYGPEALTVASIAARLGEYGLEARHLRPYRATADREVGLLAQLVPPLSKQGGRRGTAPDGLANPDGRAYALEVVHELAALCAALHGALVRQGLRSALES